MRSNIKKIVFGAMCAGALSCAVFAQEGQFTDLYYNQDLNTTGWSADRYMQNPAVWNVGSQDGPLFDGEVNSASNNLYLVSQDPLTSDQSVLFGYDSYNWNVHDIVIDLDNGVNYRILHLVPNQKLQISGDFDITLKSLARWWMPENRIALDENVSITVDGNLNVANSTAKAEVDEGNVGQNGVKFVVSSENYMPSSFEVKGNVAFKSEDTYSYWSDNILFSLGVTSFKVGGYVDMTETRAGTFTWDLCKTANDNYFSDISVGGLEGGSALQISSAHSATVNLTFANSSAHSYSGTLASRAGSDNKLNVTMDASDAQNKRGGRGRGRRRDEPVEARFRDGIERHAQFGGVQRARQRRPV